MAWIEMGRSRTTKPRPAPHSIRFPAGANVAQAFVHDAQGMGEISVPIMVLKC
jgi:hypothetical protein